MIEKLIQTAQLAQAAYASLNPGPTVDSLDKLVDQNFTLIQRVEFATSFPTIVSQYADSVAGGMGTGFNATVFKDVPGNLTLAIRGTNSLGLVGNASDLSTGLDIVGSGAGYDQMAVIWGQSPIYFQG